MNRVYAMMYSDVAGSRDDVKKWANEEPLVVTWRYDLPHCMYLVSSATAKDLSESFRRSAKPKSRFIVTEITENSYGWLPPDTWYFMKHKRAKPKPPST